MPSFKKLSCQTISDDVTVVTETRNSSCSRFGSRDNTRLSTWQPRHSAMCEIRPVSYDSSLPTSTGGERGRGGRGTRKRSNYKPPMQLAKRGRCNRYGDEEREALSNKFDEIFDSYKSAKMPSVPSKSGEMDTPTVYEIPDSPPLPSPPLPHPPSTTHSVHPRHSVIYVPPVICNSIYVPPVICDSPTNSCSSTSSSSSKDLNAVQLTCCIHESNNTTITQPSSSSSNSSLMTIPTYTSLDNKYTITTLPRNTQNSLESDPSSTHYDSNEPRLQGRTHCNDETRSGGVIAIDTDEECLITDDTTVHHPPAAVTEEEEELKKLKQVMANFKDSTRVPDHLMSRTPPSLQTTPTFSSQTTPPMTSSFNHRNTSRTPLLNHITHITGDQSHDNQSDNHHGNNHSPKHHTITTTSPHRPQLTNPELDMEDDDFEVSPLSRWLEQRETVRGGGREREEETSSVFDYIESSPKKYPTRGHPNSKSFYGGMYVYTYIHIM